MSASRPISSTRAVWLLFGLARRRFFNRLKSGYARKKKPAPAGQVETPDKTIGPSKCSGTASKAAGRGGLALILTGFLFFNGFNIASFLLSQVLNSVTNSSHSPGLVKVTKYTLEELKKADDAFDKIRAHHDADWGKSYEKEWNAHLKDVFAYEFNEEDFPESMKADRINRLQQIYDEKGSDGFYTERQNSEFLGSEDWPEGSKETAFIDCIALLLGLFAFCAVGMALGLNNKDLGQVDWTFKWLYTFPVSPRSLYFAQLVNGAVFNTPVWMFLVPLLIRVFLISSWSLASFFESLAASAYYMVLCGAVCLVIEVAARKYLKLSRLKSLQAMFTVFGMAFMFAYFACAFSKPVADFYTRIAAEMPSFLLWQPFSLPALLLARNEPSAHDAMVWCAMAVWGMIALGSVVACEWLTREGLVRAGGPYQGNRKKIASPARLPWLTGVPAKEMRLLLRDHNFMVQVLFVPLIAIGYYLIVNSSILAAARGNFHHAATLAFCVGAYGLTTSAMQILNQEKATLWQLYTFPRSILSVMAEKTLVWAGFAFIYATITLVVFGCLSRHLHYSAWVDTFIALYGVILYAFIAAGIGILATNVLDPTPRGRIRADMAYLNLILVGMYAYAIYSPSFWAKLAQLVLSTLLAYALWQKARDRLPYLLDPEVSPPPEVSLADGLIAALAFFVLQGFLLVMFLGGDAKPSGRALALAYGIAGITITILMMIALASRKIPKLPDYLGFTTAKFSSGFEAVTKSIGLGIFAGGIAALGAAVYLHVLDLVPSWAAWREKSIDSFQLFSRDNYLWMLLLLVVAAPLCEEFIFRGLVFRGLRRTLSPTVAILASAALFALVHPPVSVIPVFGLGLATALVFERTRFILAPITAHAMYNACVILMNR